MTPQLLSEAMQAIRKRGLMGIVVIDQGGKNSSYVAMCLDRSGKPCDPRNHDTHDTPDAAIADLAGRLTR